MNPPFIGPSYNLPRRMASIQRTVNLIPVPLEAGNERTTWVFRDVPGLELVYLSQDVSRITEDEAPRTTQEFDDRAVFAIY